MLSTTSAVESAGRTRAETARLATFQRLRARTEPVSLTQLRSQFRALIDKVTQWHDHFVLWPMRVYRDEDDKRGTCVWLETIKAKASLDNDDKRFFIHSGNRLLVGGIHEALEWEFRLPEDVQL